MLRVNLQAKYGKLSYLHRVGCACHQQALTKWEGERLEEGQLWGGETAPLTQRVKRGHLRKKWAFEDYHSKA